LQTQLNILYQLRNTTPSLSLEHQQKLDSVPGIEEDINNIKSTFQSQSGSESGSGSNLIAGTSIKIEKKFRVSAAKFQQQLKCIQSPT
jgi:hypothetical protein